MSLFDSGPLLAVFAHPDDELFISPLLAGLSRRGIPCQLVIATDGRFGVQPHTGGISGDELAALRSLELSRAAGELGILAPIQLGFHDGFSHKNPDLKAVLGDFSELVRRVERILLDFRPATIVTFGSEGIYGHPDHLMVGNAVTTACLSLAGAGAPRLLYPGVTVEQLPPRWAEKLRGATGTLPVFPLALEHLPIRVEVEPDDLLRARRSLSCHASQFAPQQLEFITGIFHQHPVLYFREAVVAMGAQRGSAPLDV